MRFLVLILLSVLVIVSSNALCNDMLGEPVATRHKVKFIAALLADNMGAGWLFTYQCAGVLISTHHVLSVASCFQNEFSKPSRWRVRLGSEYSNSGGEVFKVSSLKIHPDFDPHTKINNIALIRLNEEVMLSPYIGVAELPLWDDKPESGALPKVVAWGILSERDKPTASLRVAYRQIRNAKKCRAKYAEIKNLVQNSTICVGDNAVDMCSGDEGSPLIADDIVFGVASNFVGCSGRYPGIYTALSYFTDWINEGISYEHM